jgi:hypothetical protein
MGNQLQARNDLAHCSRWKTCQYKHKLTTSSDFKIQAYLRHIVEDDRLANINIS